MEEVKTTETLGKPLTVSGDSVTFLIYLPCSTSIFLSHLSLSVSIANLPFIK